MNYKEHIEHLKSFIGFTLSRELTEKDFEALEDLWKDYEAKCCGYNSYKKSLNDLQERVKRYEDFEDIDSLIEENIYYIEQMAKLRDELRTCKNELCLHCGKYKNEHLGACKDCRWQDGK